ncbi:MAG TPA: AEC family transporter [Candidatus Paceibacterota bacterium]|nr:AEC family transporter [Candidatus Paceibacterota bacterium]
MPSNAAVKELWTVFAAVLPVFGLMLAGFVLRRIKWLTADADESLLRICVNVLLPCLIFESVLGNAALQRKENLFWPPLIAVFTILLGIGVGWIAAKCIGLREPVERRTFALTAGLQNYGYIPLPLCILLFDPGTVGVLLVHNVGVEVVLWTVGMAVLSGRGFQGGWRKIINAPLVALVFALALNAFGSGVLNPQIIHVGSIAMTAVHWLGQCAIPLALLLIGAIIADHLPEIHGGQSVRIVSAGIVVRLIILPPIFFLLARWLPVSIEMKRVIVVQGAMSSAVLPVALAKHFGGDPRTALQVVLATSLVGLVAIPIWIQVGGRICALW